MNIMRRLDWYISDFFYYVETIMVAISLFFAGILYGDAPVNMKFTCEVPSQVYEYEAGDTIELMITSENVGRPFMGLIKVHAPMVSVSVCLNDVTGVEIYNNNFNQDSEIGNDEADREVFIEKGYTYEKNYTFTIPEDAPKGEYNVSVSQFGYSEVFEGLITVK
ncbi:MAG: hypothetical protein IJW86_01640 [Clostridia bacterium]|nr:hypothetical protein [Clostridia bacterium]